MTWELVEYQVLGSAASTVTFSSGLSGYGFFRLTGYVVNDANAKSIYLRFNSDATNEYKYQYASADSTTVAGARATGQAQIDIDGDMTLAVSNNGSFNAIVAKPSASVVGQAISQAGLDSAPELALVGAEWDETAAALTQIVLLSSSGNFATGTSVLLEGLST